MQKTRWATSLVTSIVSAKCQQPHLGSPAHSGVESWVRLRGTRVAAGHWTPSCLLSRTGGAPESVMREGASCHGRDELPGSRAKLLHVGQEVSNLTLSSFGGGLCEHHYSARYSGIPLRRLL